MSGMSGVKIERLGTDDPAALGPYRIIGRLGTGGMGRIYLARSGRRLVAVKTLLAEGIVSDVDRRRFAREVAVAQRVDSGYTARVLDADAEAARPWMAIEYIAAPSLAELVRTAGQPPASAVRWVGAGVAAALVALHGAGIVHRDIKPPNVLLPLNGPRVIDFGISHASDLTRTSLTLGTIAFTSPEQARGEPSTAASDIYSLGATLFHLAVGRPPYAHDGDTLGLLARVARGELELSGLPRELDQLIRPCLAADPGARPRPADVLAQFKAALVGLPVSDSGRRWLPPRWTALIEAYDQQGRRLQEGGGPGAASGAGPDDPTADQRTHGVREPDPTREYTEARAEAAEKAEREKAERERAERERERAAREHDRAERERAERRAQRERVAREMAEIRAEQERAARERLEREQAEREQAEQAARNKTGQKDTKAEGRSRAAGSANGQGSTGQGSPAGSRPAGGQRPASAASAASAATARAATTSPATPAKKSSGSGVFLLVVAFVVIFIWRPWESETSSTSSSGGSSSSSSGSSYGGSYPSDTSTTPAPSAVDLAFRAVRTGECLSSHDDGFGRWSDAVPKRVDCSAPEAYNRVDQAVSDTNGSVCDGGDDQQTWTNSGDDGVTTTLCVSRKYAPGQCFVAKKKDNRVGAGRLQTVWNCGAGSVPEGYAYIMQITGYYGMPSDGSDPNCPDYWWEVDDDENYVCAKVTS
ncbi:MULTISPECIES: serine/threonine-protein kinase [unclassified Streptomyces]|uniref:serine/threonine-protein kinase n=1 Tax=unclassified Streptomyces TaxID=2593676 RepID=UPI00081EBFBE|nr:MULTISPECIES: serine/threonine-protein kinase [unclassified Streptomyces]MYZ36659.1 protein kinase [Streptomyces sp. SID4917]SCF85294.1 Serine/threonine protein kinase [Streptomyces sp. MnatMP-M17]